MGTEMSKVLVVDDEPSMREFLQILLEGDGYAVTLAGDISEAMAACQAEQPDLIYSDLKLPDGSGMEILRRVRKDFPETQVIMMTAFGTAENAVDAMRLGAYDYRVKPVKVDEIRSLTHKALKKTNLVRDKTRTDSAIRGTSGISRFVRNSDKMAEVINLIEKVAPALTNVLVEGESGTGKELVARAIHETSLRARGPFVAVNCGAIPESLIEAELFGHVAGAFTGASKARRGLFEAAHGGTLFLDEIGELPGHMQVKLLRVLQERLIRRVGDDRERPIDIRIVAATNRDLQDEVHKGNFREDLFYRLNVVRIRVPPLRDRSEDIPVLARAFVERYGAPSENAVKGISDEALKRLIGHRFPGNVRELENYIERAVTLCSGDEIGVMDLPEEIRESSELAVTDLLAFPETGIDLEKIIEQIEKGFIDKAMKQTGGVKTRAAALLGLSFRSFRYRLQKLEKPKTND